MLRAKMGDEGIVNTATIRKLIEIKDQIEHAAAYARSDFYLTSSSNDGPNAYAAVIEGGPVVGINLAMIGLFDTDWDAYAGILSHLYAHLKLNHGGTHKEQSMQQSAADAVSTTFKSIGLPVYSGAEQAALAAMKTVYTPEEELQADRAALQYLTKAGLKPGAALGAWQRLVSVSGQRIVPILSTHPVTEQRMAAMRKLVAQRK